MKTRAHNDLKRRRRVARHAALVAICVTVTAAVATACGPDFRPDELVETTRIMAVRAEPPELNLLAASPADLAAAPDVRFTVLVDGPEHKLPALAWSPCNLMLGTAAAAFECPGKDSLGEPENTEAYQLTVAKFAGILNGLGDVEASDIVDPEGQGGDIPQTIPIMIGVRARAGDDDVSALKRLTLSSAKTPNHNPALGALKVEGKSYGDRDIVEAAAGAELCIEPEIPKKLTIQGPKGEETVENAETYEIVGHDGSPETRREDLFMTWNISGGSVRSYRTVSDPGFSNCVRMPIAVKNSPAGSRYMRLREAGATAASQAVSGTAPLPPDYELAADPSIVTLYAVLRDGRGGTDWKTLYFHVSPPAEPGITVGRIRK